MARRYRPFDPFERGGPFEPGREISFPRPPRRFWAGVALFAVAIFIFSVASPLVWLVTDLQWYDALGFRDVFTTRVVMQTSLFLGTFAVALIYLFANVVLALRFRSGPALRAVGIQRSTFRSPIGVIGLVTAFLIALVLSGGASSQWQSLALFQHATPTGMIDPVLSQDISFYLLTLPLLHAIANWALGLAFLAMLMIGAIYAWRGDTFALAFSPVAVAHLSVMLGAFTLVLAALTWLSRYDLLFDHNSSVVWGAAYTDVNARLPLYTLQAGVGIVLAGALAANVAFRRLSVPIGAAVVWIALVIVGQIYPAIVQSFFVTPNAQSYELPYIGREIAGTRAAYGLSNVTTKQFTGDQPVTLTDVQNDQTTINNLRLWDYDPLKLTYKQLQTIRTYYTFNDIDLDRYTINNQYQQVEISARELDFSMLPPSAQNWVNRHLGYTHGYGAAGSPVNAVLGEGLPDFVVKDLPPSGPLQITKPGIYFGELTGDYALAPSNNREFDYPLGSQDAYTTYAGTHGVPMNAGNRALWSLRLGDFNLLVSGQITEKTQMLYRRKITERVSEIAPFLTFDRDPYLVVVDGRMFWILDAYTTGSTYPYSRQWGDVAGRTNSINYIRNSVKVVVDAYEGTATFYLVDPKDPLIKAYQATFPSMFQPLESMPAGLRAHLRVPEGLFNVQVDIYATYHITDPKVFFSREDVWDIPTAQTSPTGQALGVQPYYVLFRLPGEQKPEFLLIMPFTPRGKNNMVSWVAARNDGAHYGEYVSYVLPKDKAIDGPQLVANRINQNQEISRDFTLFHSGGSQVIQGNLLVVPIGNSFLYFEPIYLKATQISGLPELKKVILADQTHLVYADSLELAIKQLVGSAPPPSTGAPPPKTFTEQQTAQIAELVTQINQHYRAAYVALANGDFATFGSEMKTVGTLLTQLQQVTGTSSATASPSPSPRATASPTR
jgi:uncharacterized membrane protein (UPF0182 family)